MNSDSKSRSVVKAVTWKLTAAVISLIVGYFVSGSWKLSAEITGIAVIVGLVAYYIHERVWNLISWGKINIS